MGEVINHSQFWWPDMTDKNVSTLTPLSKFSDLSFKSAPAPAVLLAISGEKPDEILTAAQDAIRKVRNLQEAPSCIRDMTLLELDYTFTNLGYFVSRVGDYRNKQMTLQDWSERPRSPSTFYAVETFIDDVAPIIDDEGEVIAVLADKVLCWQSEDTCPIEASERAFCRIGQVYSVSKMSEVRWSA